MRGGEKGLISGYSCTVGVSSGGNWIIPRINLKTTSVKIAGTWSWTGLSLTLST
jgi:hypothetical protein